MLFALSLALLIVTGYSFADLAQLKDMRIDFKEKERKIRVVLVFDKLPARSELANNKSADNQQIPGTLLIELKLFNTVVSEDFVRRKIDPSDRILRYFDLKIPSPGDSKNTVSLIFVMHQRTQPNKFTLANPPRLVVDLGIFQNRRKDIERSADISVEKG